MDLTPWHILTVAASRAATGRTRLTAIGLSLALLALLLVAAHPSLRPVVAATATGVFDVTWSESCETPPAAAVTAFDDAAALWSDWISSTVPINVSACWAASLNCSGDALACGGPTAYYANFARAPLVDVQYPAALANALNGADLDPGRAEVVVTFKADADWSFATLPPPSVPPQWGGKQRGVDFVDVALHELAHALGFTGDMYEDFGVGFCGDGPYGYLYPCPTPYDWFVVDSGGSPLLDFRTPDPRELGARLTGDASFGGPNAVAANGGSAAPLYTPASWLPGTSLSHLDQDTFAAGENRLMTPNYSGVARHPGPVTLAILQDLGWLRRDAPNVIAVGAPHAAAGRETAWSAQLAWPEYAGQSITYRWTATDHADVVHAGRGVTDTAAFNWTAPGRKTVTVTATGMGVAASATYALRVDYSVHLPLVTTNRSSVP